MPPVLYHISLYLIYFIHNMYLVVHYPYLSLLPSLNTNSFCTWENFILFIQY